MIWMRRRRRTQVIRQKRMNVPNDFQGKCRSDSHPIVVDRFDDSSERAANRCNFLQIARPSVMRGSEQLLLKKKN
jgi:hypothetical protein